MNPIVPQDALVDEWEDLQLRLESLRQERISGKGGPAGREAMQHKLDRVAEVRQAIVDRAIQLVTKCSACGYTVRIEDHSPNCTRKV